MQLIYFCFGGIIAFNQELDEAQQQKLSAVNLSKLLLRLRLAQVRK